MQPIQGRQQQNGYLILTGGDPRKQLVRIGIQFGSKQLVVLGPDRMKRQAAKPIAWDGNSPIEVQVVVNFGTDTLDITAGGVELQASIPNWPVLSAYGFGTSNAETRFGPLQVH